ncbi:glycerol transporter [Ascosphaera pollenicola]|nr:glycerol transporter [Ascosphaera pollenicola]
MGLLRWLKGIYSLDTLDTRLTVSSTAPAKLASDAKPDSPTQVEKGAGMYQHDDLSANRKSNGHSAAPHTVGRSNAQPSKWKTPEFYFYYLVFLVCVPLMFKSVIDVSQHGWIPGRKVDNSDLQYAGIRGNYIPLLFFLIFHPLLRRLVDAVLPAPSAGPNSPNHRKESSTSGPALEARLRRRISFDYYFGFAFVTLLNGISVFKILAILIINYNIATKLPRNRIPVVTWIFNLAILFGNELCRGYPLAEVARVLITFLLGEENKSLISFGQMLDSYGGLIPRWEVFFKVTILRLISFNMDHYWSLNQTPSSSVEKRKINPETLSERERVSVPAPAAEYSFRNFTAYVLYSPLYITGPIIAFNDYISQSSFKAPSITTRRTILYAIRFLITLLCMELMLHYVYVVAISRSNPNWSMYTPFQLSMLGYFNLHHIWLKLLLPWRFFRLWALLDGIDPPENMIRCMSDNYSALAFWRSWHRSFNRWVVRYLYIPLGGGANRGPDKGKQPVSPFAARVRAIVNFLVVFTFVAVWHDINLRLLMWSWLITLFVLPEIIATMLFPPSRWKSSPTAYRMLCAVGAVANILMMMTANLVGFALGLDGLKGLVHGIIGSWAGVAYMAAACCALFVGTQVMFEVRELELRAGIRLKC